MAYIINKENKTVLVKKDCKTCNHIKVCVFHQKMKQLCESKEFYGMNEYLEWNNSLQAFENNAQCMHYSYKYKKIIIGESVTIDCDPNIIKDVINASSFTENWIKNDMAKFRSKDENGKEIMIDRKVSDVLLELDYKFI